MVLVQVGALVGRFPQPVAGSDALLSEIGAAVEQVRAATTARELYTPLVVLGRHGNSVDEVFASLNATCVLPEDDSSYDPPP